MRDPLEESDNVTQKLFCAQITLFGNAFGSKVLFDSKMRLYKVLSYLFIS